MSPGLGRMGGGGGGGSRSEPRRAKEVTGGRWLNISMLGGKVGSMAGGGEGGRGGEVRGALSVKVKRTERGGC